MSDWRLSLSRFRFSFVELFGITAAFKFWDLGQPILGMVILVAFAIAQAVLTTLRPA